MYRIGFIIKGYEGKSEYYNANVKPFVDLSYGLKLIGYETILFIDESERHLERKIKSIIGDEVNIVYFNSSNIEKLKCETSIEYIIVEDNIDMMKTALKFRNQGIKIAVFVQYLYGVNTNRQIKRAGSIQLTFGSYLPWRLLTKMYRDLLAQFDYIIPNSHTCGYLLRQLYDVHPSGTVYPPVGVDMRPILGKMSKTVEKSGILIFAGNIDNDYFFRNIKEEIKKFLTDVNEPVKLFVSNHETATYFSQNGVELYSKLPVEDLVKLYAESKITYVPTEYELFGHVGAESLLCGTPVILDAYHPFLESFPMETKAVRIAHPNNRISEVFLRMMEQEIDTELAKKSILDRYSAEESAKLLLRAIEL